MTSSAVFLDGPLAGTTREFPTDEPPDEFVFTHGGQLGERSLDLIAMERRYQLRPNHLDQGPPWIYTLPGSHAGERVRASCPVAREYVGDQHAIDYVVEQLKHQLHELCAPFDLVPTEIREVFRGTYEQAQDALRAGNDAASGVLNNRADVVWIVYQAVAMPHIPVG